MFSLVLTVPVYCVLTVCQALCWIIGIKGDYDLMGR